MKTHTTHTPAGRLLSVILIIMMTLGIVSFAPAVSKDGMHAMAASTDAYGKIDASDGAVLRQHASTSSAKIKLLQDNSKVTIIRELFTTTSTKASKRWFYVSAAGKYGYIRSDLVDSISYANLAASVTKKINYRTGPSTDMSIKGTLAKGKGVTVLTAAKMKGSDTKWYKVRIGSGNYFITAKNVTFSSSSSSSSSDEVSVTISGIRKPICIQTGKGFTVKGVIESNAVISKVVIGFTDRKTGKWLFSRTYSPKSKTFDIYSADKDITFGKLSRGTYNYRVDVTAGGKTFTKIESKFRVTGVELIAKLLGNPTSGGKARYVYTFTSSNCTKLFSIEGLNKAIVPQGMAFTGSEYYIVYGMKPAQAIVTYNTKGEKIKSGGFSFNMGHPNGMTWDPKTKLCYIFKGNQKTIYTWNPKTNKYGKSKTPYSSSGVAYDNTTKDIYATSQTGVRVYSSDGKFRHQKLFSRCSHGISHYIQDCGAQDGFIFHCISGSNKQKTNFVDIYRAEDGKYLGSIKVTIGEVESAVVGNDGHVQLLINTPGKTDYIWRTPLNVKDLKM